MKSRTKHTNDILYFGLWQKANEVDTHLEEINDNTEKRKALIAQIRFRQKVLKQVVKDKKLYYVSETGKQHSVEKLKENVMKLINEATEGPSEEIYTAAIPLLVGKKVIHSFDEGKWPGRVPSVVKGFPEFYIVCDCDTQDTGTPTAIYTYKLKEGNREATWKLYKRWW